MGANLKINRSGVGTKCSGWKIFEKLLAGGCLLGIQEEGRKNLALTFEKEVLHKKFETSIIHSCN